MRFFLALLSMIISNAVHPQRDKDLSLYTVKFSFDVIKKDKNTNHFDQSIDVISKGNQMVLQIPIYSAESKMKDGDKSHEVSISNNINSYRYLLINPSSDHIVIYNDIKSSGTRGGSRESLLRDVFNFDPKFIEVPIGVTVVTQELDGIIVREFKEKNKISSALTRLYYAKNAFDTNFSFGSVFDGNKKLFKIEIFEKYPDYDQNLRWELKKSEKPVPQYITSLMK